MTKRFIVNLEPLNVYPLRMPESDAGVRTLFCYLCGRQCLVPSFRLHLASCRARWVRNSVQGDAPEPPLFPVPDESSSAEERAVYSAEAEAVWQANSPTCQFCGRVFSSNDKLTKHQTSGCSNVAWQVVAFLAQDCTSLLAALSSNHHVADLVDQALRLEVAKLVGGADLDRVRIERVEFVLEEKPGLCISGGLYGFANASEVRLARDAWLKPEVDDATAAPTVTFESLPAEFFANEKIRLGDLKLRSGVASIARLADDALPAMTLVAALEKATRLRRQQATRALNGSAYNNSVPFSSPMRKCASAYQQRVDADLREKRNRALGARLRRTKAVVSTRGPDSSRPKHCHAAVRRKRETKETQRTNDKLRRALSNIYRNPVSRLEKYQVSAVDCDRKFSHRTALYATPSSAPTPVSPARSAKQDSHPHDVPKGLGVVQCAACGVRAFSGRDRTPMRPCPDCGETFYCDLICCAVDAPAHAVQCAYAAGRRKQWPIRMAQYWVNSRATVIARKALRRRPKPSVDEVMREITLARAAESAAAAAAKNHVPEDRSTVTKCKIDDRRPCTSRIDANTETSQRLEENTDEARDVATTQMRTRLAAAAAQRAETQSLRAERLAQDKSERREVHRKAQRGALENQLQVLDERALALARERRDVMRQLEATVAPEPQRSATSKARDREDRLAREKYDIDHPRPTSADLGRLHYAK